MSKLRGNRTLTGTWGEIWVDGELIAELSKIEVKVSANREDVQLDICLLYTSPASVTFARSATDVHASGWKAWAIFSPPPQMWQRLRRLLF